MNTMAILFSENTLGHIFLPLSIIFFSWIIGFLINELIKNKSFYPMLSNSVFIENEFLGKLLGLELFKWIVRNTFFRFFNQNLKISAKPNVSELQLLRIQMTSAEISHLIGFVIVSVTVFAIINFTKYALTLFILNVGMNLYPSLLQQRNKVRIDKLIEKCS